MKAILKMILRMDMENRVINQVNTTKEYSNKE